MRTILKWFWQPAALTGKISMMNNRNRKDVFVGILGTLLLHLVIALVLLLVFVRAEIPMGESGVSVMLGMEQFSQGQENLQLVEVGVTTSAQEIPPVADSPVAEAEDMLSQDEEETVSIETKKKEKTDEREVKTHPQEEPQPSDVRTEEEIQAEAERLAAEKAAKAISAAFGKGASLGSGNSAEGEGRQGSPEGNETSGKSQGESGFGTFDLGGRSLKGALPTPVYNVQEEGRVVVTIVVNPEGRVISASIHKRTNTVVAALRKAALDAARQARFNQVEGVANQSGTITYFFKLK